MTALILFTRELARELRERGEAMNISVEVGRTKRDLLRGIADAIDAAAKRAFHL